MIDLNDLQFFTAVVESQGFSAAARHLGVPKSSVSRHIGRLETRLGVRLLERSTRSLRLTDAGERYFAECSLALSAITRADQDMLQASTQPSGTVRVSCPNGIAEYHIAPMIPTFMAEYPNVKVQLLATNRAVDLIDERIDIAIRARSQLSDEAVTVRRLGSSRQIFVASAARATMHRLADDPAALAGVPFLSFQEETPKPVWTVIADGRTPTTLRFEPVLWTSDFRLLIEAAAAGAGVALLPEEAVATAIRDNRLQRVLPSWTTETIMIHLVYATKRGLAPAIRAFIDALVSTFEARAACQPDPNAGPS